MGNDLSAVTIDKVFRCASLRCPKENSTGLLGEFLMAAAMATVSLAKSNLFSTAIKAPVSAPLTRYMPSESLA